jgi:hypothetical protein
VVSLSRRSLPRLPTRADDWRLMARTARLVVTVPGYGALALAAAFLGLSTFVFSLNLSLVSFALTGGLDLSGRVGILLGLYPFVGTGFGPAQGLLLLVVSALVGVDVAMVAYHVREHGLTVRQGGSGAAGLVFGTLGAGCAACGSALLAGLLSLVGASGAVLLLPLDGLEFALLAAVVLVLSIYWVADGMRGGTVNGCPID